MDAETAYQYFNDDEVVQHYAEATADVGLWVSEEMVFTRIFKPEQSLLELGCGAGRISIGLWELGYKRLLGMDVSRPMVQRARRIDKMLGYGIPFQHGDATQLDFADATFDGAIFGFNGLMMIPGHANRLQAMREIWRVLQPGSHLVFTAHDRTHSHYQRFWREEADRWQRGEQKPELEIFGDRWEPTPSGNMFIHVPTREELAKDLESTGWLIEADMLRSQITMEPRDVHEFSDETRFWVVRKPE